MSGIYCIGIAGGSGSGKTTFAKRIIGHLGVSESLMNGNGEHHPREMIHIMHQDHYYLSPQPPHNQVDGQPNFDSPEAFDWDLLKEHLQRLRQGEQVQSPMYDFVKCSRSEKTETLGPCKILILEGIYALWEPEVREALDLKIFLDVGNDIRFTRRLARDIKERCRDLDYVIDQYYRFVRPMHTKYLQATSRFADLTVGEETDTAAEVVAAKLEKVLVSMHAHEENDEKSTTESSSRLETARIK